MCEEKVRESKNWTPDPFNSDLFRNLHMKNLLAIATLLTHQSDALCQWEKLQSGKFYTWLCKARPKTHTHTETRLEARDEHGQTEACMWKTNTNTHASGQTNLQVCECWRWCWSIAVLYNALSSHQGTQKCKLRTVQRDKRQSQAASDFRISLAFTIQNLRFDIHIKWKHICLIVNEICAANVIKAAKNRAIKAQKLHANKRARQMKPIDLAMSSLKWKLECFELCLAREWATAYWKLRACERVWIRFKYWAFSFRWTRLYWNRSTFI